MRPGRFRLDPIHRMPGPDAWSLSPSWGARRRDRSMRGNRRRSRSSPAQSDLAPPASFTAATVATLRAPGNGRGRNGVSTVASARQRRLPTRPRASATEAHASASSLRTVPLPLGRADPTCTRTRPPLRIDPADRRAPPWIPTPVVGCDRHRARRPWGRAGAAGPRGGPHELRRKEALTRPPEASSLAAGDATGAGERSDRP